MPAGIVSLLEEQEVSFVIGCDQDGGSDPCDSCDNGGDCVCDAGDGTWT